MRLLRVATYNIHKGRGLDQRVQIGRIAEVLREIDADIIALQEVLSVEGKEAKDHQARFIAREMGFYYRIGENRRLRGGAYGNVTLSRFPLVHSHNYDITQPGREQRAAFERIFRSHPTECSTSITFTSVPPTESEPIRPESFLIQES
jgi:endonuclease/exonuclease/phosphatase family metal-dependent hydrolase